MMDDRLYYLVTHLLDKRECSWVEFKVNNSDPQRIGRYVSALANSAALDEKPFGYLIWGIEDDSRKLIGTDFDPATSKKGNQSLEFWLAQQTDPTPPIEFKTVEFEGTRLVIMQVGAAASSPVRFEGKAYIRIGDATPDLTAHSEREKTLWSILQSYRWEEGVARQFASAEEVTELLDYKTYFRLLDQPIPEHRDDMLAILAADRLIKDDGSGRWDILNLGAILFAEQLASFGRIGRKAVRVIRYVGDTRVETVRERVGAFGYAKSFEALIAVIDAQIPKRERIGKALREVTSPFSELSIRELVANALIHQDMTISGAGPMVEIFDNRIEITNPGRPLVEPNRFIDHPPRSRNESMASLMRRMNICEERGSGIDKVVFEAERSKIPPPDFTQLEGAMRVTLYGPRPYADMTPPERTRACYQHATMRFLQGERATNASLRDRLGIETANAAQVSRVFKQAFDAGLIKLADVSAPRSGYVPFWA
jgi:ATP-dependent DNA helicase RecG